MLLNDYHHHDRFQKHLRRNLSFAAMRVTMQAELHFWLFDAFHRWVSHGQNEELARWLTHNSVKCGMTHCRRQAFQRWHVNSLILRKAVMPRALVCLHLMLKTRVRLATVIWMDEAMSIMRLHATFRRAILRRLARVFRSWWEHALHMSRSQSFECHLKAGHCQFRLSVALKKFKATSGWAMLLRQRVHMQSKKNVICHLRRWRDAVARHALRITTYASASLSLYQLLLTRAWRRWCAQVTDHALRTSKQTHAVRLIHLRMRTSCWTSWQHAAAVWCAWSLMMKTAATRHVRETLVSAMRSWLGLHDVKSSHSTSIQVASHRPCLARLLWYSYGMMAAFVPRSFAIAVASLYAVEYCELC